MIKDRLHATSLVILACHLYPVAAGTLLAAHEVMYKNFKVLVLLQFMLI